MKYLLAYLKGDAAKLINPLLITDTEYEMVLTVLQDRYEPKGGIGQAHPLMIWSQHNMKCESGLGLQKLLNSNEQLRALKN